MKKLILLSTIFGLSACTPTIEDIKKMPQEQQEEYYFKKCKTSKTTSVCMAGFGCAPQAPSAEEILKCKEEAKNHQKYIEAGII